VRFFLSKRNLDVFLLYLAEYKKYFFRILSFLPGQLTNLFSFFLLLSLLLSKKADPSLFLRERGFFFSAMCRSPFAKFFQAGFSVLGFSLLRGVTCVPFVLFEDLLFSLPFHSRTALTPSFSY